MRKRYIRANNIPKQMPLWVLHSSANTHHWSPCARFVCHVGEDDSFVCIIGSSLAQIECHVTVEFKLTFLVNISTPRWHILSCNQNGDWHIRRGAVVWILFHKTLDHFAAFW